MFLVVFCFAAASVPVLARPPHANHGSHGRGGRVDIKLGPYGFGYQSGRVGIHVGPAYRGYIGPVYRERIYVPVEREAVPEAIPVTARAIIETNGGAAAFQARAERDFRKQRYFDALREANHSLVEDPNNGKVHLFLSQALFAVGEYRAAADAIHQGVLLTKSGDWGYIVENYRQFYTNADYVKQMEQLDEFIRDNPEASYARLVRGYHYLFLGHEPAARRELARVMEAEHGNRVVVLLIDSLDDATPAPVPNDFPEIRPPQRNATTRTVD